MRYALLASLALAGITFDLHAQYRPVVPVYPPYGRYPGVGYGIASTGYGNALYGAADLQRANSQSQVNTEEARLLREKYNQDKIDTRKKAFDEMMYEKANTPTYLEELTRDKVAILNRMMSYPIRAEITDGRTLNVMLPYLQSFSTSGTIGAPIPIPQSQLANINVAGAGSSTGGSVGMLANGGQVEWPLALQGQHSQALDKLLPAAYDATLAGKLTPKLMKQIRTEMTTMRETLREQIKKEEIETSSYLRGVEFYNSLESSVNALERPDARKQLNGTYAAKGRNVQELVEFMTDNGLRFAPAAPGGEDAYQVVHDCFVRYARVAQSSAGFQSSNMPVGGGQTMIKK